MENVWGVEPLSGAGKAGSRAGIIKVFVATKKGQGKRKNDFFRAKEGELVGFPFEHETMDIDDSCGCHRSMSGFETLKATTTFKVVEKKMTKKDFIDKYMKSKKKAGRDDLVSKWELEKEANYLLSQAKTFPVNKVLEKRGTVIKTR